MTELIDEVNRSIRALAAKVDPKNDSIWEFVCECGHEGCSDRIGLTLARYDELKAAGAVLLAPHHTMRRIG